MDELIDQLLPKIPSYLVADFGEDVLRATLEDWLGRQEPGRTVEELARLFAIDYRMEGDWDD